MIHETLRISILLFNVVTIVLSGLLLYHHRLPPWNQLSRLNLATSCWSATIVCNFVGQVTLLVSISIRFIKNINDDIPPDEGVVLLFNTLNSIFSLLSHLFIAYSSMYRYQKIFLVTLPKTQGVTTRCLTRWALQGIMAAVCGLAILSTSWPRMGWWRKVTPAISVALNVLADDVLLAHMWCVILTRIQRHVKHLKQHVPDNPNKDPQSDPVVQTSSDPYRIQFQLQDTLIRKQMQQSVRKPSSRLHWFKYRLALMGSLLFLAELGCAILYLFVASSTLSDYFLELSSLIIALGSIHIFASVKLLHYIRKGLSTRTPNESMDGFTEAHVAEMYKQDAPSLESASSPSSHISSRPSNYPVSFTFSHTTNAMASIDPQ